jgi:hypothetical protein
MAANHGTLKPPICRASDVSWIVFRRWLMPIITPARAYDTQIHAHPPKEGLMGYRISRRLGLNPSRIWGTKSGQR